MFARFLSNTRGGVAPLMAIVAVPVLAAVGIQPDRFQCDLGFDLG